MTASYTFGTVTVTQGSTTVTGDGTGWQTANISPGYFGTATAGSIPGPVQAVVSDTELTLVTPWQGESASGVPYWLSYDTRDGQQTVNNAQRLAEYIARLDSRALAALAGLVPRDHTIPLFTGETTATLLEAGALSALSSVTPRDQTLLLFTGANTAELIERSSFGDMKSSVYDPKNIASDAFLFDNQTYSGRDSYHIAEGDSLGAGTGLPSPSTDSWFAVFSGLQFQKRAIGRSNVSAHGSSIQATIPGRYNASVRPFRPTANGGTGGARSYLYLTCGQEDILQGRTFLQILNDMVSYIGTARADGFTVVLGTITPHRAFNDAQDTVRRAVNAAIRRDRMGANIVWDMEQILQNPFDPNLYMDNRHYSPIASTLLARYLDNGMRLGFSVRASPFDSRMGVPVSPSWELISAVTAPGGTVQNSWIGLSEFSRVRLTYQIIPQDGSIFGVRTTVNNGAVWNAGAGDYHYHGFNERGGQIIVTAPANIGFIPLNTAYLGGNTAEGSVEIAFFNDPNLGSYQSKCRFWNQSPVVHVSEVLDGYVAFPGARNGIQFNANSGSYYGSFKLEGLRT